MSMQGAPAGLGGNNTQKSVMVWEGPKLRTDNGTVSSSIVDFKTDTMLVLDHEKKQYSEVKISALMAQMKAALEMMKSQAQALPPEQRKAYEDMIKRQQAPVSVTATDEQAKLLGLEAKKYTIKQGERSAGEVWYTKAIDLSDLGPYMKQYADMMKGSGGSNMGEVYAKIENGYPLKSVLKVDMMGLQVQYVTETTKYEKVSVDGHEFVVPTGYKKVDPNASQVPGKSTADPGGAVPANKKNN